MSQTSVPDFSEQWADYTVQEGYYASDEMLQDYFGPLLTLEDLKGKSVCEVGCGNGRFVKIMSRYATSVTGIEPSAGALNSKRITADSPHVEIINRNIYEVDIADKFDYVFCLGVLHHTPEPVKTVSQIKRMLKPGGKAVIWVYGREGNGLYLALANILRLVTTWIPHSILKIISKILCLPLKAYIWTCKYLPLPMRCYMRNVLAKYDDYTLELTIYDQLNPKIAGYWSKEAFNQILQSGGFEQATFYHRHGYSWTAMAIKK